VTASIATSIALAAFSVCGQRSPLTRSSRRSWDKRAVAPRGATAENTIGDDPGRINQWRLFGVLEALGASFAAEKVRPQFLSLRQLAEGRVLSRRSSGQLSPVTVAISRLIFGLPIARAGLLFSERPVSLRSSGLRRFGTVFEIRTFRDAYEPSRKEVLRILSDRRGRPISSPP
jgi:hypothetical protein